MSAFTKKQKVALVLPSTPRHELDIVAYKPATGELLVLECKSYIDSKGVEAKSFGLGSAKPRYAKRYKLFNNDALRRVVLKQLRMQLLKAGMIRDDVEPRLGLVCGKIGNDRDRELIRQLFKKRTGF